MDTSRNWRELTRNPSDAVASEWMKERVARLKFLCPEGIRPYLDSRIAGKSVLDIGIICHELHSPEQVRSPEWRHGKMRQIAAECWGVDILEPEIEKLREWGLDNVHAVDATGDAHLGRAFDAVHVGDVIEHVSNPVALLKFALRHLAPGGRVYVTTPNPFCWQEILHFITGGYGGRNAEHIAWITPTMAIEIAHRAGGELDGIGVTLPGIGHPVRRAVARFLNLFFPPELFGGDYLYVFKAANPP